MWTAIAALALALQKPTPNEAPRLVVLIAVDQLIPEQLQRLESRFTGGFKRFLDQGTVFWRATVDYAGTETGPGHATLATGRWPMHHGIVGNLYFERASGSSVYCVGDPDAHPLTTQGVDTSKGSVSPARLLGPALGDLLAARWSAAKTITLAGKDRSAILLGGQQPAVALWWDGVAGGFTSSSAYGEKLPDFVNVWNARWAERARAWEWRCELEGDWSALGTAPDERNGESTRGGKTLPRTLPKEDGPLAAGVLFSPLLDFFTLELTQFALEMQGLGQDEAVDLLGISLSGCDLLGHSYGPDSVEVTDLMMRNDRALGAFLALLDAKVGAGRWVACLSSDHGVLDLPEMLQAGHVGARRVKGSEVAAMKAQVDEALASAAPEGVDLKLRYAELGFAFDEAAAESAGLAPAELRALIAEAAESANWVEDAYTLEELTGPATDDPWLRLYQRSTRAERCADVVLRPDSWLLFDFPEGTSHGSPYPYDRRVPLAFLGAGVKAQQRFDAASPTDAVPTLLDLLGVPRPADLDGRVLSIR
jgi:predicted AlkP superfamily pyrophosphatase or phosphodiesterase